MRLHPNYLSIKEEKGFAPLVLILVECSKYRIQQLKGASNTLNDRAIQRTFNNGGNTVHAPN